MSAHGFYLYCTLRTSDFVRSWAKSLFFGICTLGILYPAAYTSTSSLLMQSTKSTNKQYDLNLDFTPLPYDRLKLSLYSMLMLFLWILYCFTITITYILMLSAAGGSIADGITQFNPQDPINTVILSIAITLPLIFILPAINHKHQQYICRTLTLNNHHPLTWHGSTSSGTAAHLPFILFLLFPLLLPLASSTRLTYNFSHLKLGEKKNLQLNNFWPVIINFLSLLSVAFLCSVFAVAYLRWLDPLGIGEISSGLEAAQITKLDANNLQNLTYVDIRYLLYEIIGLFIILPYSLYYFYKRRNIQLALCNIDLYYFNCKNKLSQFHYSLFALIATMSAIVSFGLLCPIIGLYSWKLLFNNTEITPTKHFNELIPNPQAVQSNQSHPTT